jgi:hypothetical protein
VRQLGEHKATRRSQGPSLRFDLFTRPGDANTHVSLGPPAQGFRDRPENHLGNICSKAELESSDTGQPADRSAEPTLYRVHLGRSSAAERIKSRGREPQQM